MVRWLGILFGTGRSCLRTHRELALENLALRQQLAVWKAREPRPRLTRMDQIFWVLLSRVLAAYAAGGAAGDSGWLAPAGISTVLGMEESTPMGSARDWAGPAGSDTADEPRESAVGCAEDPRRAVEARPDCLASEAAVTGMANILEEPR